MTQIRIIGGLPFTTAILEFNSKTIKLDYVLIDTGSETCIFKTDDVERLGMTQKMTDKVRRMRGIGGEEFVVEKQVDRLSVGDLVAVKFAIQTGALDYGIQLDGIIGTDFLRQTGAVVDFTQLIITK